MLSRRLFEEAARIRSRITYQELILDPAYMEKSTSACFLPHAALVRFPYAAKRLHGQQARTSTISTEQQEIRYEDS
jgi:hypothetical protein